MSAQVPLKADSDEIRQFVDALFAHASGGRISLRSFFDDGDGVAAVRDVMLNGGGSGSLVARATEAATAAAQAPRRVVFAPPVCIFGPGRGATEADVTEGIVLSAELDDAPAAARRKLEHLLGPATVVVESGGLWTDPETGKIEPKLHVHWRLAEPTRAPEEHARLKQARSLAAELVGGDASSGPIPHPLRWPGSWHRKAEPRPARIVALNQGAEIDLDEALELLQEAAGAAGVETQRPQEDRPPREEAFFDAGDAAGIDEVKEALDYIDPDLTYRRWFRVLAALHDHFGADGAAIAEEWSARGEKYNRGEVARKWRSLNAAAASAAAAGRSRRRVGIGTLFAYAKEGGCDLSELALKHRHGGRSDDADGQAGGEAPGEAGEEAAPGSGGDRAKTKLIRATPYVWAEPETIPTRSWLYGRHLIRKFVSATIAPGGSYKTSLGIVESLAMVSGRDLLGMTLPGVGRLRVWYLNLEDPREEMVRQIQAAALHYGLTPDDIGDRLFADSGREQEFVIAETTRNGATIIRPVVNNIIDELVSNRIDVLEIDPFVSSHRVSENNSGDMDLVAKQWGKVAEAANCAIELKHHTRKQLGDMEINVDSARGAKAVTDACRSVRVINKMTKGEAESAGVKDHRRYFRVYNDKPNLAPPSDKSDWFCGQSVSLGNGVLGPSDEIGVVTNWTWPDAFAGVTAADAARVRDAIGACAEPPRADVRATNWAGKVVAQVLGLDLGDPHAKARVKTMLETWIGGKVLAQAAVHSTRAGRDTTVIVPGPNDPRRPD